VKVPYGPSAARAANQIRVKAGFSARSHGGDNAQQGQTATALETHLVKWLLRAADASGGSIVEVGGDTLDA
jgi:hypothetical protein